MKDVRLMLADRPREMVLLAGGNNTRMEALRGTIYKAFLPIHGLSCIARHVIRAAAYGIGRVDVIVDVYDPALSVLAAPDQANSTEQGPEVRLLVHPGSPAEKIVWWHRDNESGPTTIVVVGDTLAPVDISELWWRSVNGEVVSVIAVADVSLPFGIVTLEGDIVRRFLDNPPLGLLVNTGYMALTQPAIALMAKGLDLNPALELLAQEGNLKAFVCEGPVIAVDSLGSLATAHDALRRPTD